MRISRICESLNFAKYVLACNRRISRVSELLSLQNIFPHTTGGFPEYLIHLIFRICFYIQPEDFPSMWVTEFCKVSSCIQQKDTPSIWTIHAGTHFERSMAQTFGKSAGCVRKHTLKNQWLRHSVNPPDVCGNTL